MGKPKVQISISLSVLDAEKMQLLEARGATRKQIFLEGLRALDGAEQITALDNAND
jgi:hypothetical protein